MKHIFLNSIMVIAALCTACLIGEGLLILKNKDMKNYNIEMWRYAKLLKKRSADPILGHEHRLNQEALLQSVRIRTNNFGLRGPDVQISCSKKRRILFLGTSATLGWGVPESQTLPEQIAKALGKDTEVLNAGIGNYNTTRYVQLFMTKLAVLNPTDIVINYFLNDTRILKPEKANWFLSHSQLAVTFWGICNNILTRDSEQDMLAYYKSLYQPQAAGYKAMLKALDRIQSYASEKNIRMYFIITPEFYLLDNYQYQFIHDIMKYEALKRSFKYIDTLPAFKEVNDAKSLWAMPTDHHPNAKSNQIIADYCIKNNFFRPF